MIVLADNRKARFNYFIKDKFEAGISLTGGEVKSARAGKISLDESFVFVVRGKQDRPELVLKNCFISRYEHSIEPPEAKTEKRDRKLLLHKSEIEKIAKSVLIKGNTCVATKIYLNGAGLVKAEIALATGKHAFDKKQVLKERDILREAKQVARVEF